MFIADAHCDTLYALTVEKKPPEAVAVTRERLARGGVGLQTFALFVNIKRHTETPYVVGRKLIEKTTELGVPFYKQLPDTPPDAPSGILSIEGGEMLEGSFEKLLEFHAEGVKLIALTWNHENEIGHPALLGGAQGLKPFGRALIPEMDKLGVLSDVSHLNEAGFWDVAELTRLPIVASHSNLKTLCDTPRNLTPDQVKAVVQSKGFIGINFYAPFLARDGGASIDDVLRHIDAIAGLGGIGTVGFGSDFDGIETWPEGLASPADFPAVIDRLLQSGYTQAQVEGIAGLNLWRVLKEAEKFAKAG